MNPKKAARKIGSNISLVKTSMLLSIALIFCKLLSFFRDALLAQYLGVSIETDAFLASSTLLMLFASLITGPIASAYLPFLSDHCILYSEKERNRFIGTVYAGFGILSLVLMAVEAIFLKPLIHITLPGFNGSAEKIIYLLVLIQLPCIFISILRGINCGNLQYLGRFSSIEVLNCLGAFFTIIYLLFARENTTVYLLAFWFMIGNIVSFIVQFCLILKSGFKPKLNLKITHELKQMLFLMLSYSLASGVREINTLVDKAVSSQLPSGSITILSYANKLTVSEVGLVSVAISVVAFAQIAKFSSEGNLTQMKSAFSKSFTLINSAFFPLSIFTILFRTEIITILFGRGAFTQANIVATANTMAFYAIGLIGFGMQDILTRSMMALKKSKYTIQGSILMVIINIVLNLSLYRRFGNPGIAFASSISVLLEIPFLLYCFHRNIFNLKGLGLWNEMRKIIVATGVASIVVALLRFMPFLTNEFLILLVGGGLACATYFVCLFILKGQLAIELVQGIRTRVHSKVNK